MLDGKRNFAGTPGSIVAVIISHLHNTFASFVAVVAQPGDDFGLSVENFLDGTFGCVFSVG